MLTPVITSITRKHSTVKLTDTNTPRHIKNLLNLHHNSKQTLQRLFLLVASKTLPQVCNIHVTSSETWSRAYGHHSLHIYSIFHTICKSFTNIISLLLTIYGLRWRCRLWNFTTLRSSTRQLDSCPDKNNLFAVNVIHVILAKQMQSFQIPQKKHLIGIIYIIYCNVIICALYHNMQVS